MTLLAPLPSIRGPLLAIALAGLSTTSAAAMTVGFEDGSRQEPGIVVRFENPAAMREVGGDFGSGAAASETSLRAGDVLRTVERVVRGEMSETQERIVTELGAALGTDFCDGPHCAGPEGGGGEMSELDPVPAPVPPGGVLMGAAVLWLGLLGLRRRRHA